jgi:hypothetical protein
MFAVGGGRGISKYSVSIISSSVENKRSDEESVVLFDDDMDESNSVSSGVDTALAA